MAAPAIQPETSQNWLNHFEAYSAFHALTVLACTLSIAAVCVIGRRAKQRDPVAEQRLRYQLAWCMLGWQAFATIWRLLPMNYTLEESWPLHLCRVVGWVAPFMLMSQHRRLRAVVYFWGLGLSTQAFFTPVLGAGYSSELYWFFWLGHTQIVGSAIYDVWVRGFRPGWKHFGFAILAGVVYTLAMVGFNELQDTNYGYVGRTLPEKRTILNELPPWPWRVVALSGLAIVVQFLVLVPWLFVAKAEPAATSEHAPEKARDPGAEPTA